MKGFVLAVVMVSLWGCAASSSTVSSLTAGDHGYLESERERKLHEISALTHQELVERGMLYSDPAAIEYLDEVASQLIPAGVGTAVVFSFYILKDSSVNAFAMPNGSIYLNIGLLSRLDNEAELAFVLSHEIAHVVERHGYQGMLNRRNTVVAAHVADLFLFGTGLAYIPAGFELAAHSRQHEMEADLEALDYMAGSAYDLAAAIGTFDKLAEVKHSQQGSIWASHPDSETRTLYVRDAIDKRAGKATGAAIPVESFEVFRRNIAELNIRIRLRARNYELSEDAIRSEIERQGDQARWQYYLGEAYRGRARHPEASAREHAWLHDTRVSRELKERFSAQVDENIEHSAEHYRNALALDPDYAKAKRGLGLLSHQRGDLTAARGYLQEYLDDAQEPADRIYIENILRKINSKGTHHVGVNIP